MVQLDLFAKNSIYPFRHRINGKRRQNGLELLNGAPWDLWSQGTDLEKEMALFFLDIRDFTPLAEKHQAFDVIQIIKKLFSTFQHLIRIHHGRIIETTGDGFYAVFGFDGDGISAVDDAVKAGRVILKTLEQMNSRSFEKNLSQRIDVGIGIHVGKVAIGNLHLGMKDHLVVMGYPVNVASRLQAATKELNNNFIISADAYKKLPDRSVTNSPIKATLKGLKYPVELHLVGKAYVGN